MALDQGGRNPVELRPDRVGLPVVQGNGVTADDDLRVGAKHCLPINLGRDSRQRGEYVLAAARTDAKRLHEKIDGARSRLEGLLSRLPG